MSKWSKTEIQVNAILDAGFRIERVAEPFADEETIARYPTVADSRIGAYYLHVRCRKPQLPAANDS